MCNLCVCVCVCVLVIVCVCVCLSVCLWVLHSLFWLQAFGRRQRLVTVCVRSLLGLSYSNLGLFRLKLLFAFSLAATSFALQLIALSAKDVLQERARACKELLDGRDGGSGVFARHYPSQPHACASTLLPCACIRKGLHLQCSRHGGLMQT